MHGRRIRIKNKNISLYQLEVCNAAHAYMPCSQCDDVLMIETDVTVGENRE